jgi:putative transposase
MRFAFIDAWKEEWPVEFLCRIMPVTSRGYRAWRVRPMSQRQRGDMVILAHIREQHRLSLNSYGRPRMTEELQEMGLRVGHRRIGRLMRMNGIKTVRTRKYKVRSVRNLIRGIKFGDARRTATMRSTSRPTCWIRIFPPMGQIRNALSGSCFA